jgi:hypothetical protein
MHVDQLAWSEGAGWAVTGGDLSSADLVVFFGSRRSLACGVRYRELRAMFPSASILGCSTGGQIHNEDVSDHEIAAVSISFDATSLCLTREPATSYEYSRTCGEAIGRQLSAPGLAGIFVLSDGLSVNGSELVSGILHSVGNRVPVTGGLAGDGAEFRETLVGADCAPQKHLVGAVGFYGSAIRIGHGSAGGWDEFGPRRQVTRSRGNVLFELDGEPALDLYERYLGEEARGLPGSGLLFPLRIFNPARREHDIVRTVLAVDHEGRSMTFAGDVPQGWTAQLMRGVFDRLATGAAMAARQATDSLAATAVGGDRLAILVSCIGRRLLMGQHIANELEAAGAEIGLQVPRLGFYSYGEISPHRVSGVCELHNQTMTVTTLAEAA